MSAVYQWPVRGTLPDGPEIARLYQIAGAEPRQPLQTQS
jgi:hypothetical protein